MKPQQIVFPEDKLIRAYYNRHPTAKFFPIDLHSNKPFFIRNFAKRQLKVMRQKRVSEKEALSIVEAEARDEDRRAHEAAAAGLRFDRYLTPTHTLQTNHIQQVQAEEELAWQATKDEQLQIMFEKQQEKLAARAGYAEYLDDEDDEDKVYDDDEVYDGEREETEAAAEGTGKKR